MIREQLAELCPPLLPFETKGREERFHGPMVFLPSGRFEISHRVRRMRTRGRENCSPSFQTASKLARFSLAPWKVRSKMNASRCDCDDHPFVPSFPIPDDGPAARRSLSLEITVKIFGRTQTQKD